MVFLYMFDSGIGKQETLSFYINQCYSNTVLSRHCQKKRRTIVIRKPLLDGWITCQRTIL